VRRAGYVQPLTVKHICLANGRAHGWREAPGAAEDWRAAEEPAA